jgi:CarD family transcriptional regulator
VNFEVGDTVVHWTHGIGTVISIDEIDLAGEKQQYYVVEVGLIKVWVPVAEAEKGSLRFPMESTHFTDFFEILGRPGESLPDNQYLRRLSLRERMQKRTLEGLCHIIRDLADRSRDHSLTQYDASVLYSAEEHLLDEWALSLGVERANALSELEALLKSGSPSGLPLQTAA